MGRRGRKLRFDFFQDSDTPVISLTPLIDTVLVLLIIFMVTTPSKSVVESKAPEKSDISKEMRKAVIVAIGAQGTLYVDGAVVTKKSLKMDIKKQLASSPLQIVAVSIDKKAPQGSISWVFDTIRSIEGVRLVCA